MIGAKKQNTALTGLDGRLCQVYPDHLTLGASLAWAEVTTAMGTLGLIRPGVKTGPTDPEMWGINTSQWDGLWISSSSDAELISPYWSFYRKDIIFPFCQLCIPLRPNLLQLR